jgi:LAGLIDADG endonuclease
VSGIKNKKGFVNFSNEAVQRAQNENFNNKININDKFLHWFSGFTDAEGNFLITIDRNYVKLRFKISLHIDDIKVLQIIQSNLDIGRITEEQNRNRCSFIVEDISGINTICSIFNNYSLHTSKKLDFKDFYEALLIKTKNQNLSDINLERILYLKNNMNKKRVIFSYDTTKSQIIINPNWFIGFIEGEGTFGIKTGSSLYLHVAQKNTSQECLNAITNYIINLSNNTKYFHTHNNKILPINLTSTTNARTNVVSLVVANIDALYYYILPLLDESKFYSRKAIDFKIWRMALILKIYGYYYTLEGKKLFLDISEIINKRYSTAISTDNVNEIINNISKKFEDILKKDSPFDIKLDLPHTENVRKFSIANRSEKPKIVYIYTNEGLIAGSPFTSFSAAHKALGLNSSSNTCNRYIDTNRLYKNKYIFFSKPIDSASRD